MKFRRSGRHTTPSQVEKVAEKAGKAAPAMAVSAGVLMAAPHGHNAAPVKHDTVAAQSASSSSTVASLTASRSYSCSGLEALWKQAGGSAGEAVMAASIAMAESGGNPSAVSPTADYGLWQINASHGSQATLDPLANAQAAVSVSNDGTNWNPWTTYASGAYSGRC
jgi:hypothetical protein